MENLDIRSIFFYEFKQGHDAELAAANINAALGENVASSRTIRRWFDKFRSGDTSLENLPRGRPPTKVDEERLKALVEKNPRITVKELAAELEVSDGSVSFHLKTIGKVRKLDRRVPHELNDYQKTNRYSVCSSLLLRNKNESFLDRVVIFNKNGFYTITEKGQDSDTMSAKALSKCQSRRFTKRRPWLQYGGTMEESLITAS